MFAALHYRSGFRATLETCSVSVLVRCVYATQVSPKVVKVTPPVPRNRASPTANLSWFFTRPEKSRSLIQSCISDEALTPTNGGVIIQSTANCIHGFMANPARKLWQTEIRTKPLTPRVRLATRLYHTGAARTKREAALAAGLTPSTFYIVSNTVPAVQTLADQVAKELEDETIDTGRLLRRLGRKALVTIARTMENPLVKAEVQLKAAQDLADRSPETSKVLNINAQVAVPLSDDQVAALRRSMIEAASLKASFASAAQGNFVTVSDQSTVRSLDLVASRAPSGEKLLPGGEHVE